jgi:hypothetical protein
VQHDKYWRLVIFHKGKRTEKRLRRTRENTERIKAKAVELELRGIKHHIVGLTDSRMYPRGDIAEMRHMGKMWCPYCGDWRWFKVPKLQHAPTPDDPAEITREMFLNSCWRQGIKVCAWCEITEGDWYVCKANGTFGEVKATKRRRRGRRTRTGV